MIAFDDDEDKIIVPEKWETEAMTSNTGIGRGVLKKQRICLPRIDLYHKFCQKPSKFQKHLFLKKEEFDSIINDLQIFEKRLKNSSFLMDFRNKILLSMLFVIEYPGDKLPAERFQVSEYYVSSVLDETLPILVEYFNQFIPNVACSEKHSVLSKKIQFITDCTIHRTRRTTVNQSEHFNGHYQCHGRITHLLVDFEGRIIAYKTLVPGRSNDALTAIYNKQFQEIIGSRLALGDPGFRGTHYIVGGYGSSELTSAGHIAFYEISKREQRFIEHINAFWKQCKSLSKEHVFIHRESRLLACVAIAAGLYNLKWSWGYFASK